MSPMFNSPLGHFTNRYFECEACGLVDCDERRMEVGYRCPRCGTVGTGALSHFRLSVEVIGDLIRELFPVPEPGYTLPAPIRESHRLALVVFFCTLGEVILQHFLERCMEKMCIPAEVQARLLADNLYPRQRIERLFPVLTGVKWHDATEAAGLLDQTDYAPTVAFYVEATEKRNELLHRANVWAVPGDMARMCFEQTPALLQLFAALHNLYLLKSVGP